MTGVGRGLGRRTRRALLGAVVVAGCPAVDDPPTSTSADAPAPAPTSFRGQAHADGYARALPLARAALDAADPLTASFLDGTPPRPRPFTLQSRGAIDTALTAAWKEAAALRGELLPVEQAALLDATRFALSRVRDEVFRLPATRLDPAVGPHATAALVDEIAARGRTCDGCDAALADGAKHLDAALADLGATTPAAARATASDCLALRDRLMRMATDAPAIATGTAALGDALVRCSDRLGAVATALDGRTPSKTELALESIAPASAPTEVQRLADRLGARMLRRWLEVHEHETREPKALLGALVHAAGQLRGLALGSGATPSTPTPVDAARCDAQWKAIDAFAGTQTTLVRGFDCTTDLWRLPAIADDEDLAIALVEAGVVIPTRRHNRKQTEPTLARVWADVAPHTHRHALVLAVLSGAGMKAARTRAAAAAHRSACTAIVALQLHGEVVGTTTSAPGAADDVASLMKVVGEACTGVDLDAARATALSRPAAALAGVGIDLLTRGPADAVALERGWWLPIGFVLAMARPEAPAPDVEVTVKTEPIVPGEADPP